MPSFLDGRLEILHADITRLEVDAIVNAANPTLLGGGGVDGAIHRAAGPELLAECRTLGGARPGEVKVTGGYRLPARFVFHAVGPVWRREEEPAPGEEAPEDRILARCYGESLRLAAERELASLAFPAISTGVYGFPKARAARIALAQVREGLSRLEPLRRVILCCFSEADQALQEREAAALLALR
ncbi:O-acetyl-ADP-ribose deacetylase [Anaeromyxobacter paludicola]|uniref:Macro domain-containing protein n=1 Tax=Anaeromyxobacter paludicola TaxID=2918171 RepID=A0ABM7XAL5_9BACT|nr:O-acetyl-ADP-ribose deacetylase [Anaeromyxobacter paludicola]BDG08897.1 macro domain-containing protein [Anaeromyxobacter paludicola]